MEEKKPKYKIIHSPDDEDDVLCGYYHFNTKLFKGSAKCTGKIVRREVLLNPDVRIGGLQYTNYIERLRKRETDFVFARIAVDEMVPWYWYQCENGHIHLRPEGWAINVSTVPPGTIKSEYGTINKPPKWFLDLSEEEQKKVWKR